MKLSAVFPIVVLVLAASSGGAQGRAPAKQQQQKANPEIPESARPPAGMCRIWLEDVPVAQQPAPTDCASAVRSRPAKGRVIFGDDYVSKKAKGSDSAKRPPVKGFAPQNRKP
jgi:hypothetical protein